MGRAIETLRRVFAFQKVLSSQPSTSCQAADSSYKSYSTSLAIGLHTSGNIIIA